MKVNFLILFVVMSTNKMSSQVGINTTAPTKTLDVNGEVRIRTLPVTNASTSLTVDASGNVGVSNNYVLYDLVSVDATAAVDYTPPSTATLTKNDINLGISQTVTIPANKNAKVVVHYSVPMGLATEDDFSGYLGIRFLKNTVEAEEGSRKFTIDKQLGSPAEIFQMFAVTTTYTETFAPNASPTVITYALNGYMEMYSTYTTIIPTIRYNMWSTGTNYNWGRATMSVQVFIKD
ncbi:hypothetical protein G6N05_09525 [Flavobacterium sp. F372]|uniref:DUF1735 domain-containing protein n=1 Tax=Flavobacterium bernardetii TaxID=2813823 RepID=A0ABR7IYA2_9FLAO|nr:hypothetical protein [Flavobacterium bernardetii]MBC5834698.1 hypothetical protein [Flavobacterium bernardetii]NHF70346.1 hypothetical protein [Flavobacterium bernardetii]